MTKQFSAHSRVAGDFTIISLSGELDAETNSAEAQLLEIIATADGAILIDCADLNYISSAGVSVFLSLSHACRLKNIPVTFFNLQPKIRDVLELIGLVRIFSIAASLEEAMLRHKNLLNRK